ncbi:MAG: hypothetical protein JWM88_2402 [Verrucomicrobia bacterium]|nr:hypothetical protein [Verrucomicrobiota bacterium]
MNSVRHFPPHLAFGALLATLASSCASPPVPLEDQRVAASARWSELSRQRNPATTPIAWRAAVARMEADNPKLRQAREAVRAGEEAVRQVPRNYIPELSLNLFAYPTLGTLGEGRLGDTFFFLGTIINLPNPVQYQAEALQARLRFMAAQVDTEILRRDLHVRLYRVFRRAVRLMEQEASLSALRQISAGAGSASWQADALVEQNRAAWRLLEPELAELLGDYSRRWRPEPSPVLPVPDYAANPPPLDGKNQFAALQITKAALQLVALDAQRQGLLVAEWPQVAVLLSAPPIYQRSAGRESYLSFEDLRVSGFIAYSTDLRGSRALARKQAARRSELTRRELDLAMQSLLARLQDAAALLNDLESRAARLRRAEIALEKAGAIAEAANLRQQADELSSEIDDLNLSFWVLDDARWQAAKEPARD